jgi:hypothetical protein
VDDRDNRRPGTHAGDGTRPRCGWAHRSSPARTRSPTWIAFSPGWLGSS